MAKAGSMVAYAGDLSFTGRASAEGGITGFLEEAATGEGTPVMTVEGRGHVYRADDERKVRLLALDAGDATAVNGEDVLAFESDLSYEISAIDSLAGERAGEFTNVYLEGPGRVAITTHGDPLARNRRSRPIPARRSPGAASPPTWSQHEPLGQGRPGVRRALPDGLRRRGGVRCPAPRGTRVGSSRSGRIR